ncbi:MAG TPA: AAA family ATPase [Candidatus Angelobacter sp.]|nr:AAA family ATPase [Candidatus Angelobacter sp.]
MELSRIEISNYRSFDTVSIDVDGSSVFLISENGGGKTTVLNAIAQAIRGEPQVALADFRDPHKPLELVATLRGFSAADQATFPDVMSFGGVPSLRIGYRAEWDAGERSVTATHGYPDKGWPRASREQREALPLLALPAIRDAGRLLGVVGTRSLLARAIAGLSLEAELQQARDAIALAAENLAAATPLQTLLAALTALLEELVPGVAADALALGADERQPQSLLREFDLLFSHNDLQTLAPSQSSGLAQLLIHAIALYLLERNPGSIFLLDEPEVSLHPQAQRALIQAVQARATQAVIATHSGSILNRVDPRRLVRLRRSGTTVSIARPSLITDSEAIRLARFATSEVTEAYFARKAILVEGTSDRIALLALAQRLGRRIDAAGVSIVCLDGGGTLATFLGILGPTGLELDVLGLCDEDQEGKWLKTLAAAGFPVADRTSMETYGFYVCTPDLEGELVTALGAAATEALIDTHGEKPGYERFAQQPSNRGKTASELLAAFARTNKVFWAPIFVDALDLNQRRPRPLFELIRYV